MVPGRTAHSSATSRTVSRSGIAAARVGGMPSPLPTLARGGTPTSDLRDSSPNHMDVTMDADASAESSPPDPMGLDHLPDRDPKPVDARRVLPAALVRGADRPLQLG